MLTATARDSRFLILAPTGADALNIGRVLARGDLVYCRCADVEELWDSG